MIIIKTIQDNNSSLSDELQKYKYYWPKRRRKRRRKKQIKRKKNKDTINCVS